MKIVAIGDSITAGYPFTQKESWVTILAREANIEVINKGINGDLTKNICDRFRVESLAYNPTHVIILGGTNDAYARYSLESVTPHFTEMIKMSQGHGIIPILGLPTPSLVIDDEYLLQQYRNWLISYAKMNNLLIIDFYTPFLKRLEAGEESKLFADEVHPSIEGYKFMAVTALNFFRSFLVK